MWRLVPLTAPSLNSMLFAYAGFGSVVPGELGVIVDLTGHHDVVIRVEICLRTGRALFANADDTT